MWRCEVFYDADRNMILPTLWRETAGVVDSLDLLPTVSSKFEALRNTHQLSPPVCLDLMCLEAFFYERHCVLRGF